MEQSELRVILAFLLLSLAGCGEAVFFKHLRVQSSTVVGASLTDVVFNSIAKLGYTVCEQASAAYCNKQQLVFTVKHQSPSAVELVFYHGFGAYPGPDNPQLSALASEIRSQCEKCIIQSKESSKWGFRESETSWQIQAP